jgi:hypothetical protein
MSGKTSAQIDGQVFYIKRNDTLPSLQATLTRSGSAVNLTGLSVKFHMRDAYTGTVVINSPATIVDAVNGIVEYLWEPADTVAAGLYEGEFEVTIAPDKVMTFPNDGHILIHIVDDIA